MFSTFNTYRSSYLQNRTSVLKYGLGTSRPEALLAPTAVRFIHNHGRGGQDLTNRDIRLSKSVRKKQLFSGAVEPEYKATPKNEPLARGGFPSKSSVKTFRGIIIPDKPRPPDSDECCMSGCAICVYDLYLTSLDTYRDDIAAIHAMLQAQNIPDSQWPAEIRATEEGKNDSSGTDLSSELDVNLSAFAQLERTLRASRKIS